MDLESFENSKEMIKGKVVATTAKKGRDFPSRIRFGRRGLGFMLQEVEFCGNCNTKPIRLDWTGRKGEGFLSWSFEAIM